MANWPLNQISSKMLNLDVKFSLRHEDGYHYIFDHFQISINGS